MLIADLWTMTGRPYRAFQVDDQRRLGAMLGAQVGTIVSDFEAARTGGQVLLEAGANRVELTALWMRKTELQEDLTVWGRARS